MVRLKQSLIWLCTLPLLAAGCQDDEPSVAPIDQLPPATQTGAYTFGCLVNGEARVAESTNDIGAIYQEGVLQMYGEFDGNPGEYGISMDIRSMLSIGQSYDLTKDPFDAVSYGGGA